MQLYQIKIRPLSPWRTPWQADTLAGLLSLTLARTEGAAVLQEQMLARSDDPPFLLSDAFPGDYLPVPEVVRLQEWDPSVRKKVKQARFVTRQAFQRAQRGHSLTWEDFVTEEPFGQSSQMHNTLNRLSNTTGTAGSLFQRSELILQNEAYLSIYARVKDDFTPHLLTLLRRLSDTGFGADTSIGKGQFEFLGCEPMNDFDELSESNGVITLSTFQPAAHDPTSGYWEAFVKYGKVAPEAGLTNVFKHPMVLLRPGACFRTSARVRFLGRAIPMEELLWPEDAAFLRERNINLTHFAYGLTVPAHFIQEDLWSEL